MYVEENLFCYFCNFCIYLYFEVGPKYASCQCVLRRTYPGDYVPDVVMNLVSGVQRIIFTSVLVIFQEKMLECEDIFLFEGDHHLVAQSKRN